MGCREDNIKCLARAGIQLTLNKPQLGFLNAEWLQPPCPGPEQVPQDPKQKGPTPRRSCPPGGASCAWRWLRPPPAHTAASLSLKPSAGLSPGAPAAGPPAAGPGPVRVTRKGRGERVSRDSVSTAGMGGTGRRGASNGLPQPCPASAQVPAVAGSGHSCAQRDIAPAQPRGEEDPQKGKS